MKIQFVKIAQYGSTIPSEQKYDYYCQSSMQLIDPDIDLPISYASIFEMNSHQMIYSSPMKRAVASARYLSKRVVILDQLSEIKFDLSKLVTRIEYEHFGSMLVRERFVLAFVQDQLLESRLEIISRVRLLINKLIETNASEVVCISHSFFMKVVEAYLNESSLLENPLLLSKFIVASSKTYSYGGGFIYKVQSKGGDL